MERGRFFIMDKNNNSHKDSHSKDCDKPSKQVNNCEVNAIEQIPLTDTPQPIVTGPTVKQELRLQL